MRNIYTAIGIGDHIAIAERDDLDFDPRKDFDNAATMVCWHGRYNLGDEQPEERPDDWRENLACSLKDGLADKLERMADALYNDVPYWGRKLNDDSIAEEIDKVLDRECEFLSLALLDHSGLRLYEGSSAHWSDCGGWDSGPIGWIYMTRVDILRTFGGSRLTRDKRERARRLMRAEIEEYSAYVAGDVFRMSVYVKFDEMPLESFVESLREGALDELGEEIDDCGGYLGGDAVESGMRISLIASHEQARAAENAKLTAETLPGLLPYFEETRSKSPFDDDEIVQGDLEDLAREVERRMELTREVEAA